MDVRGGVNYYHNVALSQGAGPDHSTDIGIPGANLDEFTSGLSRITIGGYSAPVLGFSPSLPWDRSEKTWNVATTVTKLLRRPHREARRRVAAQPRHAAADAGCRRTARPVQLQRVRHRAPDRHRVAQRRRQLVRRRSCSTGRTASARDLKVIDEPGTQHCGHVPLRARQVAGAPNITVDLGLRWEYYTPLKGLEGPGSLSNYDPATNTLRVAGYGDTERRGEREEHVHELRAAHRRLVAAERRHGPPRRVRRAARFRSRTTATRSTTR